MAIIDSTNILDTTMNSKATLGKNLVGSNYYIKSLQEKRNQDWYYRYNVIDIEEEKEKVVEYTSLSSIYYPIEAVIMTVKTDTGEKLSDDWRRLAFKDLNYDRRLGKRYRFGYDFENTPNMTDEEKHYNNSIWITTNVNSSSAGADVVVRRCDSNIMLVGSPTLSYDNITENHAEPCIVESDLKYINIYYNQEINIPQAEIYIIMQYNFFTKNMHINNRLIIGNTFAEIENNQVYTIKAIEKFSSLATFKVGYETDLKDTPTILIGLDRDVLMGEDDYVNRIAERAPMYLVDNSTPIPVNQYYLKCNVTQTVIPLGTSLTCGVNLYKNNQKYDNAVSFVATLEGVTTPDNYYTFTTQNNTFTITSKKEYDSANVKVTCICITPDGISSQLVLEYTLGGFY